MFGNGVRVKLPAEKTGSAAGSARRLSSGEAYATLEEKELKQRTRRTKAAIRCKEMKMGCWYGNANRGFCKKICGKRNGTAAYAWPQGTADFGAGAVGSD